MLAGKPAGHAEGARLILVDTSVWVKFFNEAHDIQALHLRDLIDHRADLALTDLILTEVLQGLRDEEQFASVRAALLTFPIFRAQRLETFIEAARLYRRCRRQGATVRTAIDCLIAVVAMGHGLELFHDDRDFDAIARCASLTLYRVR